MDFTQVIGGSPSFLDTSTYERYQAATLVVGEENYQIYNKETLIGRDELCDIVIRNQAVSCRHAVIEVEDKDSHVIYDLGSTNKTRLGKMVLKPHIRYHLRDGETLIFGNITTTYNYFEETDRQKDQGGRSTPTLIPESPERCDMIGGVIAETPCKEGSFIEGTLHETSTDLFQDSNTPIGSPSIYDIQTETMVELDLKSLPNNSGDDIYEIATQEKSFETNENSQNINVEKKCNTNFEDSLRADETLTDYNISKLNSVCNISLSHESTSSSNQTGDPNVSFGHNKEDIGVNVKKLFTLPILNKPESSQNIIYTVREVQSSKDNFKSSESLTSNSNCGGLDASFSEMLTQPPSVATLFARADSPNTCEPVIGQKNVAINNLKSLSDSSDRNVIAQKGYINSHKSERNEKIESSILHDTSISDLPTQSSLLLSKSTPRRELFKVPEEVKRTGISVDNRVGKTYCNSKAILLDETEGVALSEMLTQPKGQLSFKPTCKDPDSIYNENPTEEGALHNLSISDMLTQPAVLSTFESTCKNPKLINNEKSAEEVALYNTSISDMLTQSNAKSSIKVAYKDLNNEQSAEELDLQNTTISDMFSQIRGRSSIEPICENPKMIFLKETTEELDNNMSISDMLTQPNFENITKKISPKKPPLEFSKMDSKGTVNDETKVIHFEECEGIMDPNNMSMSDMLTQPTTLGFEPLFREVTKPHHQYVLDNGSGNGCSVKGTSDDPGLGNIEKRSEITDLNNMSMSDMLTQPTFEPLVREVTKPHQSELDEDSGSGGSSTPKDTSDDPDLGNIEKRSEITDFNNMSMSDMLTQPTFEPLMREVTKTHQSELDKDSGSGGSCSAKDTFDDPELGNIEKRSEIIDLNNMSMSDMLTQPILFKPPIKEIAPEDSLKCSRTKKNIRNNIEINVSNEMDMTFIPSKLNIVCQPAVEKMKNYEELNIQPSIKSDNQSQKFLTSDVELSSLIHKGCRGDNEPPNHENLSKTLHQIKSHKPKNCTTISNKVIGGDLGFSNMLTQPSGSTLIESGVTLESHYEVEDISEMLTQPSRTASSDISKSHTDVQSSERNMPLTCSVNQIIVSCPKNINIPNIESCSIKEKLTGGIPTIVSLNSSDKCYEQETQLPENNDEERFEPETTNELNTSHRNKKLVSDKSEQDQTVDEVRTNESNLKNIAENSSSVSNAGIVQKDEATSDPSDEEDYTPVVAMPKRKASKKLPSDEEESQENSEVFIKKPKKPMKILLSDDDCNQTVEENEVDCSIKSVEHLKKTFSSTKRGKSKFSSSMKNMEESRITNVIISNNPDKQSGKFSNIQKSLPLANCVVKLARLEVISNDKISETSGKCGNELEKKLSSSSSDNVNVSYDSGTKRKSTPLKSKCKSVLLSLSKALLNLKNTEVDETDELSKDILSTAESVCEEKEGDSKSLCSNKDLSRIDTHEFGETGASLDNKIGPIAFDRILMKQEKPICTSTPMRKSFKNFKKTSINSSDLHNTTITLTRDTSGKIKDVPVERDINEVTLSPSKRSSKTVFLKSNSDSTVTKVEINDSDKRSTRSKKSVDQIGEENNIFIENDGRFQKKDTFPTQLEREDKDSEQKFISSTIHSDSKQNIKRSNFNISNDGILNKALEKQNIQSENLDSKEELGRGRRKCTKKQFEGFETDIDIASRVNKQTRGRKDSDPKFQQVPTRKLRSEGGQEHVQAKDTNNQIVSLIDKIVTTSEAGLLKKGKTCLRQSNKQSLTEEKHLEDIKGKNHNFISDTKRIKLSSDPLLSVEQTGRSKGSISSIDENTSKTETGSSKKGKLGTPSKNKQSLVEKTDSDGEEKGKLSSTSLLTVEQTGRRGRSKGNISSTDNILPISVAGPAKKGKVGTPSKNKQSLVEETDSDGEEKGKLSSASFLSVEQTGRRGRSKGNISSSDNILPISVAGPAKEGKVRTPSKNKQSLVEATDSDGAEKGKLSSASFLSVEPTGRRGRSKGNISSTDNILPISVAGPAKKEKVGTPSKNKQTSVEATDSDDEEEKRKLRSTSLLSTEETRKRRKSSTDNTKDNIVEVSKSGTGKLEVLYTNPSEEEKGSENKDINLKPPSMSPKTLENVEIKKDSPRKGKSFRKGMRKVKVDKKEPPPSPQENINSVPNLLNRVSSINPLSGPGVSTNKNSKFEKTQKSRGRKCKIETDQFEEVSNPSIKIEQESFSSGISSNLSIEYSIKHTSLRNSSSPQKSSFSLIESCNEDQGDHPSKKLKADASDMPRKRNRPCIQASMDSAEKSFTEESSINRKRRKTNGKVGKENENTSLTLMSPRSLRSESEISIHEKVMFTGYSDSKMITLIKRLGGEVVESHLTCTVLVTDKVRRTVKFLCALGKGCPIVSPDWLLACRAVGKFTDPFLHLLLDEEAENKFSFNLRSSLEKSITSKLLTGFSIFVTPTVKPPPVEMKSIIESCGGVYIAKIPASWPNQSVVISCVEDKSRWRTLKKHGTTPPIVSAEALLSGILQHKFSVNLYKI